MVEKAEVNDDDDHDGGDDGGDDGSGDDSGDDSDQPGWDPDTGITTLDPVEIVGDMQKANAKNCADSYMTGSLVFGGAASIFGGIAAVTPPVTPPTAGVKLGAGAISAGLTSISVGLGAQSFRCTTIADDPPRTDYQAVDKIATQIKPELPVMPDLSWESFVAAEGQMSGALKSFLISFERWQGIKLAEKLTPKGELRTKFHKLEVTQLDAMSHNAAVAAKAATALAAFAPAVNKVWAQIIHSVPANKLEQVADAAVRKKIVDDYDKQLPTLKQLLHLDADEIAKMKKAWQAAVAHIKVEVPKTLVSETLIASFKTTSGDMTKIAKRTKKLVSRAH
jgi:hypothetical protein